MTPPPAGAEPPAGDGPPLTGVRSTRQRTAVADLLGRVDGFRSAQELHDLLRHGGASVGLTTVYRHLQALAEAGFVDVLRSDAGEAVYRHCPTAEHHHHLVCRSCGRSVEVEGPEVEAWASRVADEHGFTHVSHTVEVFGTCSACAT
jgi:Fur family ferric uptake transcriptional regulator